MSSKRRHSVDRRSSERRRSSALPFKPLEKMQRPLVRDPVVPDVWTSAGVRGALLAFSPCPPCFTAPDDVRGAVAGASLVLMLPLVMVLLIAAVLTVGIITYVDATIHPTNCRPISVSDTVVPCMLALLYVVVITVASVLGVRFKNIEGQYEVNDEHARSLQMRELHIDPSDVDTLLTVNKGTAIYVSPHLIERIKIEVEERRDRINAQLYAEYVNSISTIQLIRRATKKSTRIIYFALLLLGAAIVTVSPMIARIIQFKSYWACGSAANVILTTVGPATTFLSTICLLALWVAHFSTVRFMLQRLRWLTKSLPDPKSPSFSSWPRISMNTLTNIVVWRRIRAALVTPPGKLYTWGKALIELSSASFFLFFLYAVGYNAYLQGTGQKTVDGSLTAMTAIVVVFGPLILAYVNLGVKVNAELEKHADIFTNMMLLNVRCQMHVPEQNLTPAEEQRMAMDEIESKALFREIRAVMRDFSAAFYTEETYLNLYGSRVSAATLLMTTLFLLSAIALIILRSIGASLQ